MAAAVDICNSALVKLGLDRISALSDQNKRAILCNEQYTKLRDELLYVHPWNFALKRADLADDGTTPEFGFANSFTLPSDYLRAVISDDSSVRYEIENGALLSDASEIEIKYIYKNTDVNAYSPLFREVLAIRIAADLAFPLAGDRQLGKDMMTWYDNWVRQARSFDAQEGTPEELEADEWLNART
jgi:hypothetical protein